MARTKLYFISSGSQSTGSLPAGPTVTGTYTQTWPGWNSWKEIRSSTPPSGSEVLVSHSLASTLGQYSRHLVARFASPPLATGSYFNARTGWGLRLKLGTTLANIGFRLTALRVFIWNPNTQQIVKTVINLGRWATNSSGTVGAGFTHWYYFSDSYGEGWDKTGVPAMFYEPGTGAQQFVGSYQQYGKEAWPFNYAATYVPPAHSGVLAEHEVTSGLIAQFTDVTTNASASDIPNGCLLCVELGAVTKPTTAAGAQTLTLGIDSTGSFLDFWDANYSEISANPDRSGTSALTSIGSLAVSGVAASSVKAGTAHVSCSAAFAVAGRAARSGTGAVNSVSSAIATAGTKAVPAQQCTLYLRSAPASLTTTVPVVYSGTISGAPFTGTLPSWTTPLSLSKQSGSLLQTLSVQIPYTPSGTVTGKIALGRFVSPPLKTGYVSASSGWGLVFCTNTRGAFSAKTAHIGVHVYRESAPSGSQIIPIIYTDDPQLYRNDYDPYESALAIDQVTGINKPATSAVQEWLLCGTGSIRFEPSVEEGRFWGSFSTEIPYKPSDWPGKASDVAIQQGDRLVFELLAWVTSTTYTTGTHIFGFEGPSALYPFDSIASRVEFYDAVVDPLITGPAAVSGAGAISVVGNAPGRSRVEISASGVLSSSAVHVGSGAVAVTNASTISSAGPVYTLAPNQISVEFAAFGGVDPYVAISGGFAAVKGVITRPGDEFIGERVDLSRGDRAFFKIPSASLYPQSSASIAWLLLTPLHITTWDHSVLVREPIAKLRVAAGPLDLATLEPAAALSASLTGDYWTLTAEPIWLCGQTSFNSVDRASSIKQFRIDITGPYNSAIASGTDLNLCLEFLSGTSDRTVTEFFGSHRLDLAPRVEVLPSGSSASLGNLIGVETGRPTMVGTGSILIPGSGSVPVLTKFGYSPQCRDGFGGVPLETSRRCYASRFVSGTVWRFDDTFYTPQAFAPTLNIARATASLSWSFVSRPCPAPAWTDTDLWAALAFASSTWSLVGAEDRGGGGSWAPRWTVTDKTVVGGATMWDWAGVSDPYFDSAANAIFWLSKKYNTGSSKWEVRGNGGWILLQGATPGWEEGAADGESGVYYWAGSVIATASSEPDLTLACMGRPYSSRHMLPPEPDIAMIAAMVLDGKLCVFSQNDKRTFSGSTYGYPSALTGWREEYSSTGTIPDRRLEFLYPITSDRIARLVLPIISSTGTSYMMSRGSDQSTWDGAAWNIVSGTWTNPVALSGTVVNAFVTNPVLSNMEIPVWEPDTAVLKWELRRVGGTILRAKRAGVTAASGCGPAATGGLDGTTEWTVHRQGRAHMPDAQTCWVGAYSAAPDASGSYVKFYTSEMAAATPSIMNDLGPKWNDQTDQTIPWTKWIVDRWPSVTSSTVIHAAYGGFIPLKLDGATRQLSAQRVYDFLRVSDVTSSLPLSGTGTTVLTPAMSPAHQEGRWSPVFVGEPGDYRCVWVRPEIEASRYDCPTPDMRWWLGRDSDLTVDDIVSTQPNMRLEGLRQLPGVNVFSLQWFWDPYSYSGGVMNNAGNLQFRIKNARGKSAKFNIFASPIGWGAWIDEQRANGNVAYPGTPENIGGMEWPVAKLDTFFYSEDDGRTWKRIWETDYVLDGASGGGCVVLNLPFMNSEEVLVAHDPMYDKRIFLREASEAGWLSHPFVSRVNSQGEILQADSSTPFSQLTSSYGRKLTTVAYHNFTVDLDPTGDLGSNFVGIYIDDPSISIGEKRLITMIGAEDSSEQSSAGVVRGAIRELLSNSVLSRRLLRKYSFLIMPCSAQQNVEDGISRYGPANRGGPPGMFYFEQPSATGQWGLSSFDMEVFVAAFIQDWLDRRASARGNQDYAGMMGHVTWHADTHSSPGRDWRGWPYTAPYINVTWPSASQFRQRYNEIVYPEFMSPRLPTGNQQSPTWFITDPVVANGGSHFYLEMPWRGPSHKGGYWWGQEALDNQATAFLAGLNEITTEDLSGGSGLSGSSLLNSLGSKGVTANVVTYLAGVLHTLARKGLDYTGFLETVADIVSSGSHGGSTNLSFSVDASPGAAGAKFVAGSGLLEGGSFVAVFGSTSNWVFNGVGAIDSTGSVSGGGQKRIATDIVLEIFDSSLFTGIRDSRGVAALGVASLLDSSGQKLSAIGQGVVQGVIQAHAAGGARMSSGAVELLVQGLIAAVKSPPELATPTGFRVLIDRNPNAPKITVRIMREDELD